MRGTTARWWWGAVGAVVLAGAAPGYEHSRETGNGVAACTSCHTHERVLSHPVNLYPTMAVPAYLPLVDGRMTCLTCHDLERGHDPSRLRVASDAAVAGGGLCAECHDPADAARHGSHALATTRAHLGRKTSGSDRSVFGRVRFDADSETCLSCHDGTVAREGAVRTGVAGPMNAARIRGEHPIGAKQGPRGVGDTLIAANRLHPAIRLFDGRVGCGSCHSPYAENEALLVMSNERSRLCLECHDF